MFCLKKGTYLNFRLLKHLTVASIWRNAPWIMVPHKREKPEKIFYFFEKNLSRKIQKSEEKRVKTQPIGRISSSRFATRIRAPK